MDNRIIHTKLYSKIALEVLQSVEGQLSDGIWENSTAMDKYWRFSDITTAPDGEVLIEINTEKCKWNNGNHRSTFNGFYDMTDAEIVKWFAAKVKHIMQIELKDVGIVDGWSRTNDKIYTHYLNYKEKITVSDVYFIYDFLLGRDVNKKYDGFMSLKIVCSPLSDEETKKEETRRANIAKLEAEWSNARKKLDIEKRMKIQLIEEEFNNNLKSLNAEYKKLRDELM